MTSGKIRKKAMASRQKRTSKMMSSSPLVSCPRLTKEAE